MPDQITDRFTPFKTQAEAIITASRPLARGWLNVDEITVTYTRENREKQTITREVHNHGAVVCVLPIDRNRRTALLARQIRVPLVINGDPDPMILEAAAGLIDTGETPEDATLREGAEELGYRLANLQLIAHAYSSPGSLTEQPYHFLATYSPDDRLHAGGGLAEEGEDIMVEEIPLVQLGQAVRSGALRDMKTIILIQHLMLNEPDLFT